MTEEERLHAYIEQLEADLIEARSAQTDEQLDNRNNILLMKLVKSLQADVIRLKGNLNIQAIIIDDLKSGKYHTDREPVVYPDDFK